MKKLIERLENISEQKGTRPLKGEPSQFKRVRAAMIASAKKQDLDPDYAIVSDFDSSRPGTKKPAWTIGLSDEGLDPSEYSGTLVCYGDDDWYFEPPFGSESKINFQRALSYSKDFFDNINAPGIFAYNEP